MNDKKFITTLKHHFPILKYVSFGIIGAILFYGIYTKNLVVSILTGVLGIVLLLYEAGQKFILKDKEKELQAAYKDLNDYMMELERRERLRIMFHDIRERLLRIKSPQELTQDVIDILSEDMGYPVVSIYYYDQNGKLKIANKTENGTELKETLFLNDKNIISKAAQTKRHIISKECDLAEGLASCMAVPVIYEGRLLGVVFLGSYDKDAFSEFQQEGLSMLIDTFAVALANAEYVQQLEEIHLGIATALAQAVESKDKYTRGHLERVKLLTEEIATKLKLPSNTKKKLLFAAVLHDVGKIAVPDNILNKPARLTEQEFAIIKRHPLEGYKIVSQMKGFEDVALWIKLHHERWDGKGYPEGLKEEEIPLEARILSIADSIDAMISTRPYREGLPFEKVIEELQKGASKQFDPQLVPIAINILKEGEEKWEVLVSEQIEAYKEMGRIREPL